jgi:predicted nucleic acid-binding protein
MGSEILVDSNVFIDLLNRRKDPIQTIGKWAEEQWRDLAICGMVRLEVMRGMKMGHNRDRLSQFMNVMVNVPSDNRLWTEATDLAWTLDRKGIVIPGTDAIIAATAMRIGAAVLTSDAHFSRIEGLQVIAPPAEWLHKN